MRRTHLCCSVLYGKDGVGTVKSNTKRCIRLFAVIITINFFLKLIAYGFLCLNSMYKLLSRSKNIVQLNPRRRTERPINRNIVTKVLVIKVKKRCTPTIGALSLSQSYCHWRLVHDVLLILARTQVSVGGSDPINL